MSEPSTHVLSFPEPSSARFELRCWGEIRLFDRLRDAECLPPRRKARAIIAYLAACGGAGVSRERLAGLLWSERGDPQARASLRQTLLELRPYATDAARLLAIERDQVRLNGPALTSDIARIEALARADKLDALRQAIAELGDRLYDGLDGLDPAFDEWLALERRVQHGRLLALGTAAAARGLDRGAHDVASRLATELQALDETNEAVAQIGMKADQAGGDASGVRRRYLRLRQALAQDLGVAPSQQTEALLRELSGPGAQPTTPRSASPQTGEALTAPPPPAAHVGTAEPSAAPPDDRVSRRPPWWARRRGATLAAGLALATSAGGAAWLLRDDLPWARPPYAPRLEVVPFVALQSDPDSKEFAVRLSDQLTGLLREVVVGLSLVGPSAQGAKTADLRLSGTATREGGQWHVREALVDTREGVALWAKEFDRPADQEPMLQAEAAGAAAEVVEDAVGLLQTKPAQRDPRAVALLLESLEAHRNGSMNNVGASRRLVEEAVARAPDYAAARGMLALSLLAESESGPASERKLLQHRAHDEAELAIRADPAEGGAYAARYMLARAQAPDDLAAAEDLLIKGLAKAPNNAFLYSLRCRFLVEVGRAREGVPFCQKALARAPLASNLGYRYADALYAAGEPELAKRAIDRAARLHPWHLQTMEVQSEITLFGGPPAEALANLREHPSPTELERCGCAPYAPQAAHALDLLVRARMSGASQDADKAVAALRAAVQNQQLEPSYLIYGAAAVGRPDAAFAMLDQIAKMPGSSLQADPSYLFYGAAAPLQRDPRFWPLAAKAGYLKYWRTRGVWPDFCSDPTWPHDCPAAAKRVAGVAPQRAAT